MVRVIALKVLSALDALIPFRKNMGAVHPTST